MTSVLQTGDHATDYDDSSAEDAAQTSPKGINFGLNLMDWIRSPKKYSKGMNIHEHIKCVEKFLSNIQAPTNYSSLIMINSLDENCQIELFAHPDYDDSKEDLTDIKNILKKIYAEKTTEISNLVVLLNEKQEPNESAANFLTRLRVKAYPSKSTIGGTRAERWLGGGIVAATQISNKCIQTYNPVLKVVDNMDFHQTKR